ncbi:MAG: FAD-binding protein [Hyphomicrobiaceae bacterium]|nr:FAD-binding protein [Hyphomicrobiaceae bacterium]
MRVLLLAEHDNVALNAATAKAMTAARALGGEVHVLVAGSGCGPVAEAAARVEGATKVLLADAPHLENFLAEELAALVAPMMTGFDALVAPATAVGKNVLPRVAAMIDVMQVSEITKVIAPDTFERPIYAGNAVQTVRAPGPKKVVTVRAASFAAAGEQAAAAIDVVSVPAALDLSEFVSAELTKSDRPELASARVIVSGGRGMQAGENFGKLIEPVADALGAAVGASRAAVDAGFVPNDMQVGQTGKVVAPELYIAVGISGAIQHLAGMKDSKVIVAINKDGEAPIFQVADYGLVADLFKALPELESELRKAKG